MAPHVQKTDDSGKTQPLFLGCLLSSFLTAGLAGCAVNEPPTDEGPEKNSAATDSEQSETGGSGPATGPGEPAGTNQPVGNTGGTGSSNPTGTGGSPAAAPSNCEYPEGPYADAEEGHIGRALDPSTNWNGYDTEGNWRNISVKELQDCDGSRGVNAIVMVNSSPTCGVCEGIIRSFNRRLAPGGDWDGKGVMPIGMVAWTMERQLFDVEAIEAFAKDTYCDSHEPQSWHCLADPNITMLDFDSNVLPLTIVIDPRTMLITDSQRSRWQSELGPVGMDELLEKNAP